MKEEMKKIFGEEEINPNIDFEVMQKIETLPEMETVKPFGASLKMVAYIYLISNITLILGIIIGVSAVDLSVLPKQVISFVDFLVDYQLYIYLSLVISVIYFVATLERNILGFFSLKKM